MMMILILLFMERLLHPAIIRFVKQVLQGILIKSVTQMQELRHHNIKL